MKTFVQWHSLDGAVVCNIVNSVWPRKRYTFYEWTCWMQ